MIVAFIGIRWHRFLTHRADSLWMPNPPLLFSLLRYRRMSAFRVPAVVRHNRHQSAGFCRLGYNGAMEPEVGKSPITAAGNGQLETGRGNLLWNKENLSNPHLPADKSARVRAMFAAIAPAYDLNNHLHSMGIDHLWRRRAVARATLRPTDTVADVACGTGDLSFAFTQAGARRVVGIDFCHPMVCGASRKAGRYRARPTPIFADGDATRLPLADESVDVVSIAYGLRNVDQWEDAIAEFFRVLRPGGRLVILEFTNPPNAVIRALYHLYFNHIVPTTASLISRDRTGAYRYLPRSVDTFPGSDRICSAMTAAGFSDVTYESLTLGICACYRGLRRD